MPGPAEVTGTAPRPRLAGRRVLLRPGNRRGAEVLHAIQAEPAVSHWWGEPDPVAAITAELRGTESSALLAGRRISGRRP